MERNVSIVELDPLINARKSFLSRKAAGVLNLIRLFKAIKGSDRVVSFYTRQNCYSILVSKLRGIPVICAERDSFFMNDGKTNHILRKLFYPHADGFIHQTKMAQEYLRNNEGVKCKDVVIPNPLWIKKFAERKPIKGRIIAVGRLADQKNYEGMIRAFSRVVSKEYDAKLYIYGGGETASYQQLAESLGISDNIIFAGMTKDIIKEYQTAEIFIMFSHGEGYPNALMEALAMGVPSISSDCPIGGPKDMIMNGYNGYLVKCGDEERLADRIIELMCDEEKKDAFSTRAVKIRETNNLDIIYHHYMDYILSVQ